MKISSSQLSQTISKKVYPLYWMSGDEIILRQESVATIIKHLTDLGFDQKLSFDVNASFDWQQFDLELYGDSLFSNKLLLELKLNVALPANARERLKAYLTAELDDRVIIISSSKLESATQNTKWFKAIEARSLFVQVWPLNERELLNWAQKRFQQCSIRLEKDALHCLLDYCEGNLLALSQQIEKITLSDFAQPIDLTQMQAVLDDSSRYTVFAIADVALEGNSTKLIKILKTLKMEGAEPILILWALRREISSLLSLKQLGETATNDQLKKHGVWPKRMSLIRNALQRLQPIYLENLLIAACAIDRMIKGEQIGNVWDELESLSLKLSGVAL